MSNYSFKTDSTSANCSSLFRAKTIRTFDSCESSTFLASEKTISAHIFLLVSLPPTGEKSKDSERCGGVKAHHDRTGEYSCTVGSAIVTAMQTLGFSLNGNAFIFSDS